MTIDSRVGANVASRRQQRNIDADALAQALRVTSGEILAWEAGAERIPPAKIVDLAELFDCAPSSFFEGLAASERAEAATRYGLGHDNRD